MMDDAILSDLSLLDDCSGEWGNVDDSSGAGFEAVEFGPSLASLKTLHKELIQLISSAEGVQSKLASDVVSRNGQLFDLEEKEKQYFEDLVVGKEENFPRPLSFDVDGIHSALCSCQSPKAFSEKVAEIVGSTLTLPMWWINERHTATPTRKNVMHQDSRDVERDQLYINGKLYVGSDLKYEGVIDELKRQLAAKLPQGYTMQDEQVLEGTLKRFARVVLNVANRTNSGGNAYEGIMVLFGQSEQCVITPDSERADPMSINVNLTKYKKPHGETMHAEYGLVCDVGATTKYLLKDPDDMEHSLSGLCSHFQQTLALGLPLRQFYSDEMSKDDGCSIFNRMQYLVWENGDSQGSVTISNWEI